MLGNFQIVQMSLALIPMGIGVRTPDLSTDALGATVAFDAAVPGSVKGVPAPTLGTTPAGPRLFLAPTAPGSPLLGTALNPNNGTGLTLTLPNPGLLYDAILSVTYRVPATQVAVSTSGMS